MKMKKSVRQWLTLLAICIAGGVIYKLAFMRDVFYVPMQEAFQANSTQLGWMISAFAIASVVCYIPGGWLVDVFPVKVLVPISLILTGGLGFWLAAYPPFWQVLLIQAMFGVSTTLLFWPAIIKGVRMLGDQSEQGRLYGLLEGGRGLFSTLISFTALWVFGIYGEGKLGLKGTIIFYSITLIVLGFMTYFLIEKNEVEGKVDAKEALRGLVQVSKLPKVWVAGAIIFFGYSFYNGLGFLTPYLTEQYGMSVKVGAALSIIRTYLIAFVAGPLGGVLADRMGSTVKFLKYALSLGAVLTVGFLLIPTNASMTWVVIGLMMVLAVVIMTIRGTYYATSDEMDIPIIMAGSAAGILSLCGNVPDIFIYTIYGSFVDNNPGAKGYYMVFCLMILMAVLGFVSCVILANMLKKERSRNNGKNA